MKSIKDKKDGKSRNDRQSEAEKREEHRRKEQQRKKDKAIVMKSLHGMKRQMQFVENSVNNANKRLEFASETLQMREGMIQKAAENAIVTRIEQFKSKVPALLN